MQTLRKTRRLNGLLRWLLLPLVFGLTPAMGTTVFSQSAEQNRPTVVNSQNATELLVELLPPTFDDTPTNRVPNASAASRPARRSSAANMPPQRVGQQIPQSAAKRRSAPTQIGRASHASVQRLSTPDVLQASEIKSAEPSSFVPIADAPLDCEECIAEPHSWQLLPSGLMYKSYLAGEKEPRFASVWLYEKGRGWVWETTIGGRVGLLRYGTRGAVKPQGWQLDVEGAAFPRIDPEEGSEMDAVDFRAGIVSTWRNGPLAIKAGYYHISSHAGDEYLLRNPTFQRIEYVRDSAILGVTYDLSSSVLTYGEVGYAVGYVGGAKPLEFQFGLQYSPSTSSGWRGAPFAAINGHLREDFDFGGNVTVMVGRQWRGPESDHLFRAGFMYFNGKSLQYQFFDKDEELLGTGIWIDY